MLKSATPYGLKTAHVHPSLAPIQVQSVVATPLLTRIVLY